MLFALTNLFGYLSCRCRFARFTQSMNFTNTKKKKKKTSLNGCSSGMSWGDTCNRVGVQSPPSQNPPPMTKNKERTSIYIMKICFDYCCQWQVRNYLFFWTKEKLIIEGKKGDIVIEPEPRDTMVDLKPGMKQPGLRRKNCNQKGRILGLTSPWS